MQDLPWLDPPYNFLIQGPAPSIRFRVTRYEVGLSQRRIDEAPGSKVLETVRLHVPPEDNPDSRPYWDITSKRLRVALEVILPHLVASGDYLELIKLGSGPSGDWSIVVRFS